MTGLDFSAAAVAEATRLAATAGVDATFVQGNVYDAVELLGAARFDLVFTGIGALCWLPDIRRWAGVVAGLLRPGGRLFLREGHPVLWSLDYERKDGLIAIETPYFEHVEAFVDVDEGTYVETDHVFTNTGARTPGTTGSGEIVTALLDRGLVLTCWRSTTPCPGRRCPA